MKEYYRPIRDRALLGLLFISMLFASSCDANEPKITIENNSSNNTDAQGDIDQSQKYLNQVIEGIRGMDPVNRMQLPINQVELEVFDYVGINFNESALHEVFEFMQIMSRSSAVINLGEEVRLFVREREKKDMIFVFLNPDMGRPVWDKGNLSNGTTTIVEKDGKIVTVIYLEDSWESSLITKNRASYQNRIMGVEVCQGQITISSEVSNISDDPSVNQEYANQVAGLGQELFCNSLGSMMSAYYSRMSYGEYLQAAENTEVRPYGSEDGYKLIVFPENVWDLFGEYSGMFISE